MPWIKVGNKNIWTEPVREPLIQDPMIKIIRHQEILLDRAMRKYVNHLNRCSKKTEKKLISCDVEATKLARMTGHWDEEIT